MSPKFLCMIPDHKINSLELVPTLIPSVLSDVPMHVLLFHRTRMAGVKMGLMKTFER